MKRTKPYVINGNYDLKYLVNPASALDFHILSSGEFGDWLTTRLSCFVPRDGVVFDIGANAGWLTLPFAKLAVPAGRVYAVEPEPAMVEQLNHNVTLNQLSNVTVLPMALQDNPYVQEIELFIRQTLDGDNLLNQGLSSLHPNLPYEITTCIVAGSTLDLQATAVNLKRLDFIKIDVEGEEFRVLKGGEATIRHFLPAIQYEYSTVIDELSGIPNSVEAHEWLTDLGYLQYLIEDETHLVEFSQPDAAVASANILCFHLSKIPEDLEKWMQA